MHPNLPGWTGYCGPCLLIAHVDHGTERLRPCHPNAVFFVRKPHHWQEKPPVFLLRRLEAEFARPIRQDLYLPVPIAPACLTVTGQESSQPLRRKAASLCRVLLHELNSIILIQRRRQVGRNVPPVEERAPVVPPAMLDQRPLPASSGLSSGSPEGTLCGCSAWCLWWHSPCIRAQLARL